MFLPFFNNNYPNRVRQRHLAYQSSSSSVAPAGLRGELRLWREGPPRTIWSGLALWPRPRRRGDFSPDAAETG